MQTCCMKSKTCTMHTHLFLGVQIPGENGQSVSDEWVMHAAVKECLFRQCFFLRQLTGFAVLREDDVTEQKKNLV